MVERAQDNQTAHEFCTKGAELNDGNCFAMLGEKVFKTDRLKATHYYIKSAETKNPECFIYGAFEYEAIGNIELARKYYLDCYRHGYTSFMVMTETRKMVFPDVDLPD